MPGSIFIDPGGGTVPAPGCQTAGRPDSGFFCQFFQVGSGQGAVGLWENLFRLVGHVASITVDVAFDALVQVPLVDGGASGDLR